MKLNLFKKVCLTVMGVGVVSSLVSVGTFATFTATTTNPSNTFAAGTLTMTNVASSALNTLVATGTAPQAVTSGDASGAHTADCGTSSVAKTCNQVLLSSNVAAAGLEPGQYVQGQLLVTNSGSLPATVGLQIQNVVTHNTGCGTSGVTGAACADIGPALAINITDKTNSYCVFGSLTSGATTAPALNATSVYVANTTGVCDDIHTNAFVGVGSAGTTYGFGAGSFTANTTFGTCLSYTSGACTGAVANTFSSFNNNNGDGSKIIYVPGASSNFSLTTAGNHNVGNLTGIKQWTGTAGTAATPESHTFVVTIAFPDTGFAAAKTLGTDSIVYGNDNQYQNESVSFDLVWYALQ